MRRIPLFATLVVLLAVAAMIGLGLWQIRRAHWKEGLLARYQAAAFAPPLHGLPDAMPAEALAFRRTDIACRIATPATQLGGANARGVTGFRNIVGCRLADGRTIMADLGWSPINAGPLKLPALLPVEAGGVLIPDDVLARRVLGGRPGAVPLLLVLDRGAAGLQPSVPPSIEQIPNNHRGYAVQWFLFAGVAMIIYLIALRRRLRKSGH